MNGPRHLLALDQGTTSSRAVVFDLDGGTVASAQCEFRQHYPRPGWVEHDPLEIWSSQQACAAQALARAGLGTHDIAGIGIANQRESIVLWDRASGRPVHPAIVWQDRRTADACARLREEGAEPEIVRRTGLRLDPYFSATKLAWLLDHVPGARRAAEDGRLACGTVDTWLVWNLTGGRVHATDASNASRTLLFNLHTGAWDPELLQLFRIPEAVLPEVRDTAGGFGTVAAGGHPGGVPIRALVGDQQAALFGQGCLAAGLAKATYGTGCFLLLHTGGRAVESANALLTTVAWRLGGATEYALEGSVFAAGAVVQWLRDELQIVRTAAELDELAASVPDANGLFLVPAFTGLGAPHWDPHARGALVGITRGANRAHLCRAALEGIAFQTADLLTAMERDAGPLAGALRVDGGASRSAPLLQFQADLLQRDVARPACVETTALGAAWLAGIGAGVVARTEVAARVQEGATVFSPARDNAGLDAARQGWRRAVERARTWAEA